MTPAFSQPANRPRRPSGRWALTLITTALLTACGGGAGEDEHADHTLDTAGRLAITERDTATLRVHDLDQSLAVENRYTLEQVPSALYTSPQGRYAVAVQRTQDQVQFVDGGVWQEDHGDHLHDYKQASKTVAWKLQGARPTHFDPQPGIQAAFFMDGNATATPVQNAGVRVLTDTSIGAGQLVASLDLSAPIHGLADPVDNKLLTVSRAADAPDTLPTHLNLYQRSSSGYSLVRQVPTRCNGMHGSASSGSHTVTGCLDGLLVVRHTSATTVDDGRKLSTPLRVGTVAGHPRLPDQFIGIATEGAAPAPVTTRFYAVDALQGSATALNPTGWDTGRVQRAYSFDRSGQRFFVLDDQGNLTLLQRQGTGWTTLARTTGVIPTMPAAAPWPALLANGAKDELYLTDPVARQLVVVNASTGAVQARHSLGYAPGLATWVGITR